MWTMEDVYIKFDPDNFRLSNPYSPSKIQSFSLYFLWKKEEVIYSLRSR
jgi:hypothetical protein